jgi:gluconolactonase
MRSLVLACLVFAAACSSEPDPEPSSDSPAQGIGACRELLPETNPLPLPAGSRLASGLTFTEGPLWLAGEGVLLFSDILPAAGAERVQPSRIYELAPGGTLSLRFADSGTNGLAVDAAGEVVGCAHDVQGVVRLDLRNSTRSVLVDRYDGHRFNSPNDLTVAADGTIYFTDPDWQKGSRPNETGIMGVYRLAPGQRGELSLVDASLNKPNGVSLAPDGRTLYVSALDGVIRRYSVAPDGSTGPAVEHARVSQPDGMSVDCAGNLYVTSGSGQLTVIAPSGSVWGTIQIAQGLTNVAFGGPSATTLFATAGNSVFALEATIPGQPY